MWWRRRRYLLLEIDQIIARSQAVAESILRELPGHDGLASLAGNVVESAKEAERCTRAMSRPWSLHRLPPVFLFTSLVALLGWIYLHFVHVASIEVAISSSDASDLRQRLEESEDLHPRVRITDGSRENLDLLARGEVDLAFVQGGVPIPDHLPRRELSNRETLLLFLRQEVSRLARAKVVLTSAAEQGSHSVLRDFLAASRMGDPPAIRHEWGLLSGEGDYAIPDDVDAVFVVKDLASDATARAVRRLSDAGFTMASPMLGVRGDDLDYLEVVELPRGHLLEDPAVPASPLRTYDVSAYVVAREGLSPGLHAAVHRLLTEGEEAPEWSEADPTDLEQAGTLLGAIKSLLDLLIFIALAFLALLGFEIASYRRRFHQLNTIITLIGIHQGEKDISPTADPSERRSATRYLERCIDLLSLIDAISGYYVQRNSSLLYSTLLSTVGQRSSSLKMAILLRLQLAAAAEARR